MFYNPFYRVVKADDIPQNEITELFVPSASTVWSEVEEPVNHIIIGPRGSGKTILMKQLHYRSALHRYSNMLPPYLGIYIQISRLSNIFRNIFRSVLNVIHRPERMIQRYQEVFADYLCLEILKELSCGVESFLNSRHSKLEKSDLMDLSEGAGNFASLVELLTFCRSTQKAIETQFKNWQVRQDCDWTPLFNIGSSVGRMVEAAEELCQIRGQVVPRVFILLDESCQIPKESQAVINVLFQRGRPFNTKLAVRPYDWSMLDTMLGVPIEIDVDLRTLFIEYPDELTPEYAVEMRKIANKVLETRVLKKMPKPEGWREVDQVDVDYIFPPCNSVAGPEYSGFGDICVVSSGIPQNMLSICCALFSLANRSGKLAEGDLPQLSADLQSQGIRAWSNDALHGISDLGSRLLCKALLTEAKRKSISFRTRLGDENMLFQETSLPEELGNILKPGFATGLFRICDRGTGDLWEVPRTFSITRTLLPCHGLLIREPNSPELIIEPSFIKQCSRERIGG